MTHLLSNSVDFNNVIGTLFNSNFPKDAFDKLEAQLRAEGLLGENEALTYGNAASILPQVALGTLTVNPDGSYSFTPVSYTHLDVYKRQPAIQPQISPNLLPEPHTSGKRTSPASPEHSRKQRLRARHSLPK